MIGALSQSVVERWLGASVAQPGRCFSHRRASAS